MRRPYHPRCLHEGDTELLENVSVAVEPPPPSLLRRRPAIEIQLQRSKFPTPEASHLTISQQNEFASERRRRRSQKWAGSPAAARSGRRTPPPATSSSGSGRCGRSPSRPLASKYYLPLLTPPASRPRSLPQPHRRDPARAARRRSGVRAPWVPPANPEDSRAGRPPHAHPPRRAGSPAAPLLIGPRAPADQFGALGIGWSLPPRPRAGATRRRAGWIGPNPTG